MKTALLKMSETSSSCVMSAVLMVPGDLGLKFLSRVFSLSVMTELVVGHSTAAPATLYLNWTVEESLSTTVAFSRRLMRLPSMWDLGGLGVLKVWGTTGLPSLAHSFMLKSATPS